MQQHQRIPQFTDILILLGDLNLTLMNTHRLLELVAENMETDRYAFAKVIEQEERAFLAEKVSELGFP